MPSKEFFKESQRLKKKSFKHMKQTGKLIKHIRQCPICLRSDEFMKPIPVGKLLCACGEEINQKELLSSNYY